jgi:hypothetical protein
VPPPWPAAGGAPTRASWTPPKRLAGASRPSPGSKADLAARGKQLKSEKTGEAEQARRALGWWKKDPALAGVRDREGLERLPEAERAGWAKLWAEVDSLLASAPK